MNLEILQASQTSLHGDIYFDLMVRESGDIAGEPFMMRVAQGACRVAPAPGTQVKATFLAGQVESLQPST
jgi:hypothetical protein